MENKWTIVGDDLTLVDELFKELNKLGQPTGEHKRKLEDKYRLEWNFNSNHIEGNTLTYGQTQMLLFKGVATGDHEKQEYDEMEAHDVAIAMVRGWSKDGDRDISEADLRQLNKVILVKPFWKEAITEDGQPTRKKIIPGEYKTSPNSVMLKNGQLHYYASPEETPAKMEELFKWYKQNGDIKPLIRAAVVHHEMTQIHPFDDGNGRVARLWANFILLKAGFPPLIIRVENKEKYLMTLGQADAGDLEPFVSFLAQELQWSLRLSIKAARGESLDEPGDLDKRIELLDRKFKNETSDEATVRRSGDVIWNLVQTSLLPLLESIESKLDKIKPWFNRNSSNLRTNRGGFEFFTIADLEVQLKRDELFGETVQNLEVSFWFEGFKKAGKDAFNQSMELIFLFNDWSYIVKFRHSDEVLFNGLYNKELSREDIETIAKMFVSELIDRIDKRFDSLKKDS